MCLGAGADLLFGLAGLNIAEDLGMKSEIEKLYNPCSINSKC